jgi:hypothetical protein
MNIEDLPEEDPNGAFKKPRLLPSNVVVPVKKTVMYEVPNGELHITLKNNSYYVEYHNPLFVGNPFKLNSCFSTTFTIEQIVNSSEVIGFLSRFK